MSYLVAIVGRPNVGKSRLFNRLSESQQAIVHDHEGVTRDRQYADAEWFGRDYTVIDTGGFVPDTDEPMLAQMRDQAQLALDEADAIIFLMDGRQGLTASDRDIAQMLRQADKPVFFAVNKVDLPRLQTELLNDFWELGVELYPVSAEHGYGLDDLMDDVTEPIEVTPFEEEPEDDGRVKVAVVGKPNAGKSSLVNGLLGKERLLTSDVAGTTRDAIDTELQRDGQEYLFIDTAGLRRKRSISQRLEQFAVVQAIKSIDRADVALVVIDATEGITGQDKKICSVVANRGRACVILVNKWDLIEKDEATAGEWARAIRWEMPFLDWAPIMFISALTGQRLHKIFDKINAAHEQWTRRIQTSEINQFIEQIVARHSPPIHRNRRLKFYYTSQVATRPPAFAFVVNHPDGVAPSYKKFLENQIRERYGFEGTPIRTLIRARKGH
jgi:GTP-binding protein